MGISVEYLIVGGGGGGGSDSGGGGGGGGVVTGTATKDYGTTFTVTVGNGGTGGNYPTDGTNGGDSVFDTVTATGGGRGQTETKTVGNGGSGGGGAAGPGLQNGGTGTSGQGYNGGAGSGVNPSTYGRGGGGGGAGGAGSAGGTTGGNGGNGVASSITGSSVTYGGGGGGGSLSTGAGGTGGTGGGGNGGGTSNVAGTAGTDGLGGGGGGASNDTGGTHEAGGNGGKGVVILKFLTADTGTPTTTGSPTITTSGSYQVYKFTSSGTISFSNPNATVNSGNPPGITVGGNTNTTVSTTTNVSINSGTTNILVDAIDATVAVGEAVVVSVSGAPNVNIAANAATITTTSNIEITEPTITNVNIAGKDAIITADNNAIINAEVSDIDIITNHPPTVTTEAYVQIAANETNIQVGGNTKVLELYPSLITSLSPWNYFKGERKNGTSLYQIYNYGSNPGAPVSGYPNENSSLHIVNGQAGNIDREGIPGDSTNKSYLVSIAPGGSNQYMFITYGIGTSITGLPQNWLFPNDANVTYEFWMRTADLEADIFLADYSNSTLNNQTDYNVNVIGIKNGYLASYSYGTASTFVSPENLVTTSTFVADENWHHYAFVKSTSGSTVSYKSYVDGVETNIPISIGSFLNGSGNFFGSIGGWALNTATIGSVQNNKYYTLYFDEIAMYKTALTSTQIQEHLFAGAGSSAVTVTASVTDIDVDAKDVSLSTVINAEKTNISIIAPGAIIATDNVLVIATSSNVELDGQDFTTSNASSIDINAQRSNVSIQGKNPQLTTVYKDFKFISAQDTALSANDAEEISSLEYGGVLYNQVKKQLFRLGNTANIPTKFVVSVVSNESALIPAVKLSLDNITYSSSVTIDVVLENNISDIIYVKFDTNILDVLGPGTFLINVEQTNV